MSLYKYFTHLQLRKRLLDGIKVGRCQRLQQTMTRRQKGHGFSSHRSATPTTQMHPLL